MLFNNVFSIIRLVSIPETDPIGAKAPAGAKPLNYRSKDCPDFECEFCGRYRRLGTSRQPSIWCRSLEDWISYIESTHTDYVWESSNLEPISLIDSLDEFAAIFRTHHCCINCGTILSDLKGGSRHE